MATSQMSGVLQHLRRAVLLRDGAGLTDGQLLTDYINRHDEAALAALVQRHGPMVWGVCRRVLRNHHDAEDAFQATFLVLVRKAASIASRELLANWLYGVAHQTARKARATAAKRKGRERQVMDMPEPAGVEQDPWNDLQPLLDQELSRLPDIYRAVIVLCDLEGKTRKEAARRFDLPEGTVGSRLTRGRVMLAKRLTRRGVALSAGALAAVLMQNVASAGAPISVVSYTIKAASLFAAGKAAAGVISPKVAALTEGVLKTMLLSKLKVMVLAVVAALSGAAGLIYQTQAAEPPKAQAATGKADKQEQPAKNQKPRPDEEQLRGTWKVVKGEENGKTETLADDDPRGAVVLTVKGETLHMKVTGEKGASVTDRFFVIKLDTTTTPKLIDLADWHKGFEGDNNVLEGVYSLDGDALTVCFADGSLGENPVGSEKSRPTTLQSKEGSNTTVWRLKREAEANKSTGRAAPKAGVEDKPKEAATTKKPTKTKEAAAANELDGSYTVIEAIEAGKKKPGQSTYAARLRKCQVIIKEGILSFVLGDPDVDGHRGDWKFTLDPSKKPGRIDLKPLPPEGSEWADPSLTLRGIYRVKKTDQGLELTIAWMTSPQGNRPENFDAKAPAEVVVRLLWRGKFETTPPLLPPEGSE
jgi:RNA polymerase sigma factor (sigma-70 family)